MHRDYRELIHSFYKILSKNPFNLISIGDLSNSNNLPDTSASGIIEYAESCRSLAARIKNLNNPPISKPTNEEYNLLAMRQRMIAEYLNNSIWIDNQPIFNIRPDSLYTFIKISQICVEKTPRASKKVSSFISRTKHLSSYFQSGLQRITQPLDYWVERESKSGEELTEITNVLIEDAQKLPVHKRNILLESIRLTEQLIENYITSLKSLPSSSKIILNDYQRKKIEKYYGIISSLDELLDLSNSIGTINSPSPNQPTPTLAKKLPPELLNLCKEIARTDPHPPS